MAYHVNKSKGYVLMYRSIMDHVDYGREVFTRIGAWSHLLMSAEWKDTSFTRFRNIRIDKNRGQLVIPKTELAKLFKWSLKKLRRWLDELEDDGQITQYESNLTTVITILNYNLYQDPTQKKFGQKLPKKITTKKGQKAQQNKPSKSTPVKVSSKLKVEKGIAKGTTEGIAKGIAKNVNFKKTDTAKDRIFTQQMEQQKKAGKPLQQSVSGNGTGKKGIAKGTAEGIAKGTAEGTAEGIAKDTLLKEYKKLKEVNNPIKKEKNKILKGGKANNSKNNLEKKQQQSAEKKQHSLCREMMEKWTEAKPGYPAAENYDFPAILKIAEFIAGQNGFNSPTGSNKPEILKIWGEKAREIASDSFDGSQPLYTIAKRIQKYFNKKQVNGEQNINAGNTAKLSSSNSKPTRSAAIRNWGNSHRQERTVQ